MKEFVTLNDVVNIILELARDNGGEYHTADFTYHIARDETDKYRVWQSELCVYKKGTNTSLLTFIIDEESGIIVIFSAEVYTFEKSPLNVDLDDLCELFEAANQMAIYSDIDDICRHYNESHEAYMEFTRSN